MDNGCATETTAGMEYFKMIAKLHDKYANVDYIHVNIPTGAAAVSKYENTIADVETIDVTRYDLADFNSKYNFDEVLNSLIATAEYYKEIAKVYAKTDFVISDDVELESLNQDNDAVIGIYISSKEKDLLNKAVDMLNAKIVEFGEYLSKYQKQYQVV